jgi:hypothetical protein
MPLISTSRPVVLFAGGPCSIGMWMQSEVFVESFVWVVATYECIKDLGHPDEIEDQSNAKTIAENNRALLEKASKRQIR